MIGWTTVYSRDFAEAMANGLVDEDLEGMRSRIEERIKERDGVERCPACGELLEAEHDNSYPARVTHTEWQRILTEIADGFTTVRTWPSTYSKSGGKTYGTNGPHAPGLAK